MNRFERLHALLGQKPRANLGFFPTPLYKLDRLSERLGVNLYVKRDDFSGMSLFGGNRLGHQRIQMFHPSFCGRALRQGVFGIAAFGHDAGGQSNAVIQLGIKAVEPLGNQRCAQQHQYPHQQG